MANINQSVISI